MFLIRMVPPKLPWLIGIWLNWVSKNYLIRNTQKCFMISEGWERERERGKMLRKRIAEKYINLESNPDLIKTLFHCPKINYCSRHRFVAKQRSEKFHYQYKLKENNYWSVVRSSILNYYAYSYMSALLMRFEKSPLFKISAYYLVWSTQQYWRASSMTITKG